MPEAAFDTLAYTRRLKESGIGETRAEALADALRAAFNEGVATKAALARLEARLTIFIAGVAGLTVAAVKLL